MTQDTLNHYHSICSPMCYAFGHARKVGKKEPVILREKREKKSWTCYVYPGQSKCMDLQAPLFLLIVFPHLTTFEAVVWTQLFDGFICHVSVGIKVGDIGAKFCPTMNGTDNGYLMFDHVRIPRNQMLMGLAKVKQLILFSSYHFFFLAEHENILISDKLIL